MKKSNQALESYVNKMEPLMDMRAKNVSGFQERLHNLRVKADKRAKQPTEMVMSDVADLIDVKIANISRYESKENSIRPKYESLVKLATFYGVTLDYLLCGIDYEIDSASHTIDINGEMLNLQQCKEKLERATEMIQAQQKMLGYYQE